MYNDTVLDHFSNPRNVGFLDNADGTGNSGNPIDGDKITIYIKVQNDTLQDIRFKTFGCGAAIAASSMLTVLAMGKTIEEAMCITNDDVAVALGGLPPRKLICSNIAADALYDAIKDYKSKNKQVNSSENLSTKTSDKLTQTTQTHGITDVGQIKRYLRHIIMPKISGVGQKKLLDTCVLLCAPNIDACDVLLNYMAASGIGHIYCYLGNKTRYNSALEHIHDLNPEVHIELIEDTDLLSNEVLPDKSITHFKILIGDLSFVKNISDLLLRSSYTAQPTLVVVSEAWGGHINLCNHPNEINNFLVEVSKQSCITLNTSIQDNFIKIGYSISYAFAGVFALIELIKVRLDIGNVLNNTLYFNLLTMEFNVDSYNDIHKNIQKSYIESTNINNLDNILAQAKALIVGTGGLGSPVALALAKAGVGTIGLVDFDSIDISNLNRQILHTTSRIGSLKVESAKQTLKSINPDINMEVYSTAFSKENAFDLIRDYDIIIDGLDNLPTRYLLNDACFFQKKPLIEAGVLAFYGQVTTIVSGDTPCYRCIFPESKEPRSAPSCSETGVLGPVPGLIGILQAVEVIKMLMGMNSSLKGSLLLYDALETEFNMVSFSKNKDCSLCGEHPSIKELGEYTFICNDKKDN